MRFAKKFKKKKKKSQQVVDGWMVWFKASVARHA